MSPLQNVSIDPEFLSTHVFVIIRFSATNWQEWCCCECKRLSIWAALYYHQESLDIPAFYHDNDCKLRRCSFFTSAVKVTYFMCGNKNTCSLSSTSTELWNIIHELQMCWCLKNTGQMNKMHRLLNNLFWLPKW